MTLLMLTCTNAVCCVVSPVLYRALQRSMYESVSAEPCKALAGRELVCGVVTNVVRWSDAQVCGKCSLVWRAARCCARRRVSSDTWPTSTPHATKSTGVRSVNASTVRATRSWRTSTRTTSLSLQTTCTTRHTRRIRRPSPPLCTTPISSHRYASTTLDTIQQFVLLYSCLCDVRNVNKISNSTPVGEVTSRMTQD